MAQFPRSGSATSQEWRAKTVVVASHLFNSLFDGRPNKFKATLETALPPDATLIGVSLSHDRRFVRLLYESAQFPVVAMGSPAPEAQIMLNTIE